jgi:excisionase family DNA binding protein
MEPLLTTEDVAGWLNVEVVTVRRLIDRGELAAYRIGGEYRFEMNDIREYLAHVRVCNPRRPATGPFERFGDDASQVLVRAQQEAQRLRHRFLGTEHLLLGLVRDDPTIARLLGDLSVDPKQVVGAVEAAVPPGQVLVTGEIGLTARAKKVLQLTVAEADRLHHERVGTVDLLVALLGEGDGAAAKVLTDLGVDVARIRAITNGREDGPGE